MRGLNQKNSVDAFTYQTSAFDYRDGPAEKLQYLQLNGKYCNYVSSVLRQVPQNECQNQWKAVFFY